MRYIITIKQNSEFYVYGASKITKSDLEECNHYPINIVDSVENKIYSNGVWNTLDNWDN